MILQDAVQKSIEKIDTGINGRVNQPFCAIGCITW